MTTTPLRDYTEIPTSPAPDVPYWVNTALRQIDTDVQGISDDTATAVAASVAASAASTEATADVARLEAAVDLIDGENLAATVAEVQEIAADAAASAAAAIAPAIATVTAILADPNNSATALLRARHPVNVKDYGATGDGATDDSAAIAAALTAAGGKAVYFPSGTYVVASATRLHMYASYSSLIGDPSGISTIRFTNAAGGIDVGNGTDFIYQNLIQNLVIDGFNVANNPLRLRKSEEMGMSNVRVHQAVVAAMETTDTSLFHAVRLQLARAPIGIKTLGYVGTMGLTEFNGYLLDKVFSIEGTGVVNLVVSGTSFIEACKAGVAFNRPGGLISVGNIRFRDTYITSALTEFSLFKGVASTGINAAALDGIDLNVYIPNVTTAPFIDFTGLSNNGSTLNARLDGGTFTATALGSGHLVEVNAAQNWYQFYVTLQRITGVTTAQYASAFTAPSGVGLYPLRLSGSGTPEGVMTAPVGSTYQNYGGGAGTSFYVKQTGAGNTGWVGK